MALLVIGAAMAFTARAASAQDNNHWENQFGTRSALMGGASVGGVRDTSAVFYNPGALALIDDPEISVNANAYRVLSTSLENGAGSGLDLDSSSPGQVPLLVSGLVRPSAEDAKWSFGYAVLARRMHTASRTARYQATLNVISDLREPGSELYTGQFITTTRLNELWAGATFAWRVSPDVGVGLTAFAAYRTQSLGENVLTRAVGATAHALTSVASYDYTNVSMLFKLGIAGKIDNVKLGAAVTFPNFRLFGSGEVAVDWTVDDLDLDGNPSTGEDLFANDRQSDLDATLNNPFSFAVGAEAAVGRTTLALTLELFAGVAIYTVLQPQSRPFGAADSADVLRIVHGYRPVINFALAVEHAFNDQWTGIVSFRSDFSAAATVAGVKVGETDIDLWHLTLGVLHRGEESTLGLGIVTTFGASESKQLANFTAPTEATWMVGQTQPTQYTAFGVGIILGYTHRF